jgi:hypothetical protein
LIQQSDKHFIPAKQERVQMTELKETQWYIQSDGAEDGPFTSQTLRSLAETKRIFPDTQIRKEGMTTSIPAHKIKGLLTDSGQPHALKSRNVPGQQLTAEKASETEQLEHGVKKGYDIKNFIFWISAIFIILIIAVFFFIISSSTNVTKKSNSQSEHNKVASSSSNKVYDISYKYAYEAGYSGGKEEKQEGYEYEPEVVLAQPLFQLLLKSMKADLSLSKSQEQEWDKGFRDGFNAGFKDGYYGNPQKIQN